MGNSLSQCPAHGSCRTFCKRACDDDHTSSQFSPFDIFFRIGVPMLLSAALGLISFILPIIIVVVTVINFQIKLRRVGLEQEGLTYLNILGLEFHLRNSTSRKRYDNTTKVTLLLMTIRKLHMRFRLAAGSMTLHDLEQIFSEFCATSHFWENRCLLLTV